MYNWCKVKNKYELYRKILCVKDMVLILFCKRDLGFNLRGGLSILFNFLLLVICILCSIMKIYIIYVILYNIIIC